VSLFIVLVWGGLLALTVSALLCFAELSIVAPWVLLALTGYFLFALLKYGRTRPQDTPRKVDFRESDAGPSTNEGDAL